MFLVFITWLISESIITTLFCDLAPNHEGNVTYQFKVVFTRAIGAPFVCRQLDCGRWQTQVNDVFTRPTGSDEATSSDLDIRWQKLTHTAVTIKGFTK